MRTSRGFAWRTRFWFAGALILGWAGLSGPVHGQNLDGMVGIQAGSISTGVRSEMNAFLNTDWRSGFSAGAFVSLDPVPGLTLRSNLLLTHRGFGFRMYDKTAGLIPGEVDLRSVEMLMDVGIRLPWPNQSASVRLFAGPAFGFELSCQVTGAVMGMRFEEACNEPVVGIRTKSVDMGLSVGGGIDLLFLPVTLVIDGRYTHGLRDLNEDSMGSESLMSRAWCFTVGLGWPFQG